MKAEVVDEAGMGPVTELEGPPPQPLALSDQADQARGHEAVDRVEVLRGIPGPEVVPPAAQYRIERRDHVADVVARRLRIELRRHPVLRGRIP